MMWEDNWGFFAGSIHMDYGLIFWPEVTSKVKKKKKKT